MKRFIAILILLSAGLNIWQMGRIAELEQKSRLLSIKLITQAQKLKAESSTRRRLATCIQSLLKITECS